MRFARVVFLLAGLYGFATLLPLYALEDRIAIDSPPAVTHPEFYYGFIGVALAWQFLFLMIARDPVRLRPAMWAGAVEKLLYGAATVVLHLQGRLATAGLAFGVVDLALGALFVLAFVLTRPAALPASEGGAAGWRAAS